MESLQHQLQEVAKRRHDLMPEHQKFQKRSQKIQSIQEKHMQNENPAAQEEVRKLRDEVKQREERILFFCRIRSRTLGWQMQTWQRSFGWNPKKHRIM